MHQESYDERKCLRARNVATALVLGSLVLGEAAERIFRSIYDEKLSNTDIKLVDLRTKRNDTDYRLLNGNDRPLYRLNIKLHGSLFRKARDLVGLDPSDCFPLATYKIKSALDKQDEEHLPYIFVVVTGSNLTAEATGKLIPESFVAATHFGRAIITSGKRALEEKIVARFIDLETGAFDTIMKNVANAKWYMLSARRAEAKLKEKLFERVFALSQPRFTRSYSNAEIDMHLSFEEDMIPLAEFFERIAKEGHFKLAGMLERGTI